MAEETTISILLLGGAVGKSTLLSRISLGPHAPAHAALPELRDDDQPFIFNISPQRITGRALTQSSYRLEFYDTSYAEKSFTLLRPSLIILCYSVISRDSLDSIRKRWKPLVETHFNYDEAIPVMLLGLQRDLRTNERELFTPQAGEATEAWVNGAPDPTEVLENGAFRCVMPYEGLRYAQEMRLDRYMECSALTGELCKQVFEDIVQTAVATTKGSGGGKTQDSTCSTM